MQLKFADANTLRFAAANLVLRLVYKFPYLIFCFSILEYGLHLIVKNLMELKATYQKRSRVSWQ